MSSKKHTLHQGRGRGGGQLGRDEAGMWSGCLMRQQTVFLAHSHTKLIQTEKKLDPISNTQTIQNVLLSEM